MCVLPSKRPRPDGSVITVFREQPYLLGVARRRHEAEMRIGRAGQEAAARRALHEALLQQEGFHDLFDRVARLPEGSGDGLHPYWAAAETFGDEPQIAAVEG